MAVVIAGAFRHHPRFDRAFVERLVGVGHHEFGVDCEAESESGAFGACAVGRVERERAWFDLVEFERVPVRACHVFGERHAAQRVVLVAVDEIGDHEPVGQSERRFDGVGEALADAVFDDEPVDDDLDGVLLLLRQRDVVGQLAHLPVDECARIAVAAQQFEQVFEFAFAPAHDRREDLEACALRVGEQAVDHLLRRLRAHLGPARRAVRHAGAREQQAQVIIDLGDGAHGGTGVAVRRLLVDRDGRAQAFDEIDVRFVHLAEELACVCRQGFDVAPLALGEQRVERHRRFARPRQAGEDDHAVAWELQVRVLEVVFTRTLDHDLEVAGQVADVRDQ